MDINMKRHGFLKYSALAVALILPVLTKAANIALLVGVSQYADPNITPLQGPENDVVAMQQTLQKHWGFEAKNIVTLVNAQATHSNILKALGQLKARSQKGDQIFIYFSGHGTSRQDAMKNYPLPHSSGAFVPYDYNDFKLGQALKKKDGNAEQKLQQQLIVGRWHMLPIIRELEKDREVTIVIDSCYSANATRSLSLFPVATTSRSLELPSTDSIFNLDSLEQKQEIVIEAYPYSNTVSIAASSESETAEDLPSDSSLTIDGKAHGLLTDMLLRILNGEVNADYNQDGQISYNEIRDALQQNISQYPIGKKQTPFVQPLLSEDKNNLNLRALFRKNSAVATPVVDQAKSPFNVNVQGAAVADQDVKRMLGAIGLSSDAKAAFDFTVMKETSGLWSLLNAAREPITANSTLSVIQQRLKAEIWLTDLKVKIPNNTSLQMTTNPELKGNGFKVDQSFNFLVKNHKPYSLILLNIDAAGKFRLLYPINPGENKKLDADQVFMMPSITVTPPTGLDSILAISLEKPLTAEQLKAIKPMYDAFDGVSVEDDSVKYLRHYVQQQKQIGWQYMTLRTYPK